MRRQSVVRDGPFQVGIAASFTEGARGVEGTFAGGGESLFAGVGVSVTNFTGADVRSAGVNAFAGAEFATDRRSKVLLCPVARVGFGSGPDAGPVDVSTAFVQGGASVGVIASDMNGLMVVSFFGLSAVYARVMTDFGGVETTSRTPAHPDMGWDSFSTERRLTTGLSALLHRRSKSFHAEIPFNFGKVAGDATRHSRFNGAEA